ncbi:hypothetical protein Tco_0908185 [Tanacetum coccineum]|uniref:Uncharacterized protein n=1 Tax=Tanacetum coccineum TaxID=301880 RepID=A0ABQ5CMJ1_9ASTR
MPRLVHLEELAVAANSRLVADVMLVYFEREKTMDMIKNDSLKDENVSIKKHYQDLNQSKAESNSNVSSRSAVPKRPKVLAPGLYAMTPMYIPPQKRNNREANTPLPKEREVASTKPHHMIAPGSSRWKPTGKIFKTVGLRWVPTGKIFTSSTTKVDSESTNGSDEDITNQYEYKQTLDVSAGTPNLSAGLRPNSMAPGHNGAGPEINNLHSSNGSISVLVYGHWSREKASIQEIDTSVLGGLKGFALANTVKEVLIMNLPDHRCSTRTVIIDPHGIRGYCNRQD